MCIQKCGAKLQLFFIYDLLKNIVSAICAHVFPFGKSLIDGGGNKLSEKSP